jgi:hypothetical protein
MNIEVYSAGSLRHEMEGVTSNGPAKPEHVGEFRGRGTPSSAR